MFYIYFVKESVVTPTSGYRVRERNLSKIIFVTQVSRLIRVRCLLRMYNLTLGKHPSNWRSRKRHYRVYEDVMLRLKFDYS